MTIVYTHRGMPTDMDIPASPGAVYEAPEISEIYRRRSEQNRPAFDLELAQVSVMLREWSATKGFFVPALMPNVRLGVSVASFIAETALYLTKRITRRRVSFQDRALLMKHDTTVATRLPVFTDEERNAVEELAGLTPEAVIHRWVNLLGVDDLSSTMQLYVGDRSISNVL